MLCCRSSASMNRWLLSWRMAGPSARWMSVILPVLLFSACVCIPCLSSSAYCSRGEAYDSAHDFILHRVSHGPGAMAGYAGSPDLCYLVFAGNCLPAGKEAFQCLTSSLLFSIAFRSWLQRNRCYIFYPLWLFAWFLGECIPCCVIS